MKKAKIFILPFLFLGTMACERPDVAPVNNASPVQSADMTLAELANSMEIPSDIDFFSTTEVSDYSERGANAFAAKVAAGETWAAKPKIKFLWHGTDPNSSGCKKPKGLCLIINFLTAGNMDGLVDVEAKVINGQLYIAFPAGVVSDFGVTSDGYFPVAVDLPIPNDVLADLGVSNSRTFIKSGIYVASMDANQTRYAGVVLDLIER